MADAWIIGPFGLYRCSLCLEALSLIHFFSYVLKHRNNSPAFFEFSAPISWLYWAQEAMSDLIISVASCHYNVYIFRTPHVESGECFPEKKRDA